MENVTTETAAAFTAGKQLGGAEPKMPPSRTGMEAIPYAVVNGSVVSLKGQYRLELPRRRFGTVTLYTAQSFIDYVNAFKHTTETRLFADIAKRSVVAVLDYHQPGAEGQPRWGAHRASLTLRHTPSWDQWVAMHGQRVDQQKFAEFIEDHVPDIAEPDGATILQVAQKLDATKSISFKAGLRLADGQTELEYNEQITGTTTVNQEKVKIPESFIIGLQPFDGSSAYRVTARLRYRVLGGGKVSLGVDLLRHERVLEEAFNGAITNIQTGIGLSILMGEAPAAVAQQAE